MGEASNHPAALIAQCPCGSAKVEIERMPSVRFLCHCTICQAIYPGDYADATLMLANDVRVATPDNIEFKKHKKPPALDRGVCTACKHPVVGFLDGPMDKRLAFIPSNVLPDTEEKPKPLRHVFYATRVADVEDDLPKTHGEFMSKLVLTPPFMRVLFGH